MKRTLKEARQSIGVPQREIAERINVTIPQFSNFENGQATPTLEDMILLERELSQPIKWKENLNNEAKEKAMAGISILMEKYPLQSVINFVQRAMKTKGVRPEAFIVHFAKVASNNDIEPLMPTNPMN